MALVKLCGVTRREDLLAAAEAGADRVGLVIDFPPSPRSLDLPKAAAVRAGSETRVAAVLVDPSTSMIEEVGRQLDPMTIQLAGHETPSQVLEIHHTLPGVEVWKTLHVSRQPSPSEIEHVQEMSRRYKSVGVEAILIDSQVKGLPGGTGIHGDWQALHQLIDGLALPAILAGGLTPLNVREAIAMAHPYGVDVATGTETKPGIKDPELLREFVVQAQIGFRQS